MRNSGCVFACKWSAVLFCKLLGQEGFLGSSNGLYQQDIIRVLIFAALGGMFYKLSNRQECFGSLCVSTRGKHPLSALRYEWVSVSLTQQQASAGGEETSAGGPGSVPALSQLSIAAWQLLRDEQLKWEGRMFISSANAPSDPWMIMLVFPGTWWAYPSVPELEAESDLCVGWSSLCRAAGMKKELKELRGVPVMQLGWDSSDHKHFFGVDLSTWAKCPQLPLLSIEKQQ